MKHIRPALLLGGMVIGVVAMFAAAQAPAQKPKFDVSSVKPSPARTRFGDNTRGNRLALSGAPLRTLLRYAYPTLLGKQVVNTPSWFDSDLFDVEGKSESEANISQAQMQLLVQSLLEDRFQLKAHREMREMPVYNLVVAKSGKLKLSQDQTPVDPAAPQTPSPSGPARGSFRTIGRPSPTALTIVISGTAIRMDAFIGVLRQYAGRPLIDKTGLSGLYDFELQFDFSGVPGTNAGAPGASEPSTFLVFTALQEQLGLKLESAKAQLEVLVIDSVQRPSEN
jgi:uncharacterized protein (TIGR03435 family)